MDNTALSATAKSEPLLKNEQVGSRRQLKTPEVVVPMRGAQRGTFSFEESPFRFTEESNLGRTNGP